MRFKVLKSAIAAMLVMLMAISAHAQSVISGKVVGTDGKGVVGAGVIIKGTSTGTVSDNSGAFRINARAGQTLEISFLGYKTVEAPAQNGMTVRMEEDATSLDEVVVVGYGTQRKATLSGSVTQVSGDEVLKGKSTTNVAAALQGTIPGLVITRTSSRPGNEGININLRGGISTNAVAPMIVIDGVDSYQWELSQINPNDIESISVLKDASAAIYGTRAAGGVILVTTKRAKEGDVKIQLQTSAHVNLFGNKAPLASGAEWAEMMIEAINNDAYANNGTKTWWMFTEDQFNKIRKNQSFMEVIGTGKMTMIDPLNANQFDLVYGPTWGQSHNVSVSGGNNKVRVMTSVGYADDRSLLTAAYDGTKRWNFRSNTDYNINKWLSLAANVSYDKRRVQTPVQGVGQGVQDFYVFPLTNEKGQYYDVFGNNNMLAKLVEGGTRKDNEEILRLGGTLTVDLSSITKGLSIKGNFNLRNRNHFIKERQTEVTLYDWDGELGLKDNISFQTSANDQWVKDTNEAALYKSFGGFVNYDRSFGKHNINFVGGVTAEDQNYRKLYGFRKNMSDNNLDDLNIGDATTQEASGGSNEWALISALFRVNYDYNGIYLFEGSFRRDGSSKLSPENRWQNFVGASAGVRFSEFEWMKSNGIFQNLKLRGSYGEMGSLSGIGNYDYILNMSTGTAIFGYTGTKYQTAWINGVSNRKRTWERVASTNIGLDWAVLNNRLSGSFDWYNRQNKGMLINLAYPQTFGATAPTTNDGNFVSKGWEVVLSWNDKIGSDFRYGIQAQLSDNRTKVTKYPGRVAIVNGWNNPIIEGKPLNSIYVFKTDGYLQSQAEVDAYYPTVNASGSLVPAQGTTNALIPGSVRKVDLTKDGKITNDDLFYFGDANPHYMFGINLTAAWKNFDFAMFFQGVGQQYVIREGGQRYPFAAGYVNQNKTYMGNCWTPENPNARYPIMSRVGARNNWNYGQYNDVNVNNCWYVRGKSVMLGYTIPQNIMRKAGIDNLRVWMSADNLFDISNVKDGYDPEAQRDMGQGRVDVYARTISFGLDLTF